jgi:hypothetical protein
MYAAAVDLEQVEGGRGTEAETGCKQMNHQRPSRNVGEESFGVHGVHDVEAWVVCDPNVDFLLNGVEDALEIRQALDQEINAVFLLLHLVFVLSHRLVLGDEVLEVL